MKYILFSVLFISTIVFSQNQRIVYIHDTNLFELENGEKISLYGLDILSNKNITSDIEVEKLLDKIIKWEENYLLDREFEVEFLNKENRYWIVNLYKTHLFDKKNIAAKFLEGGFAKIRQDADKQFTRDMVDFQNYAMNKGIGVWKIEQLEFDNSYYVFQNNNVEVEEVIYFKNGSSIKGVILEIIPNELVKIETKDKNIFVFKMTEILKITKEEKPQNLKEELQHLQYMTLQLKSPGTAALFSFLIPGLGQYYNGDIGKGIMANILYVGGIVVAINAIDTEISYYSKDNTDYGSYTIGMGVALISGIWSIVDAYKTAKEKNKSIMRNMNKYGHMFEYQMSKKNNLVFGFDLLQTNKGTFGNFLLHF